ncbi:MAG: DUF3515 domain-containing protein [Actinomycetota bacterium]
MDAVRRRNALIATALAVPITVLLAFALASGRGDSSTATIGRATGQPPVLPPITVPAPPSDAASAAPCIQVLSVLPVQLGPLAPRVVTPSTPGSPFVVAWGDPPVVMRCGVARPAQLAPESSEFLVLVGGVNWLPIKQAAATVFVSIDRPVYIEVTVPQQLTYQPLPILGEAIASKLAAVCTVPQPAVPAPTPSTLCTRRS